MEALRFVLKGKTAFFKVPEVNTYYYFTYGNLHKPALLGILGGVLGYKGYETQYEVYPEYYDKLRDLQVSIVPEKKNGHFSKKIQSFNNSVGYASKEQGGNLIIKEQWIEDPGWIVYVRLDGTESEKIADMLLNHRCTYMPYLGKNDHPATIEATEIVSIREIEAEDENIHSLGFSQKIQFDWEEGFLYKYEEYLPIALKESTNQHVLEKMILTDAIVLESQMPVYTDGVKNIVFY